MRKFVFIDESGDLGEHGSRFMVLAALIVPESARLDRLVKNLRRHRFKKELEGTVEIKANHSSDALIYGAIDALNGVTGAQVKYVVLEKKKVLSRFLLRDKHKLYNFVAGKLARELADIDGELIIRIDKSKNRQVLQDDFNNYFRKIIGAKKNTTIEHSFSHAWPGLQLTDVLAWACFQKFEHERSAFIARVKLPQEVNYVW